MNAEPYVTSVVLILAVMGGLWVVSLWLKDASIVDIGWGAGFALLAAGYWLASTGSSPRQPLISMLAIVWGLRLALHLARRNLGKGEDARYARWRAQYGAAWWWRSLLQVFVLQGVVMWLISMPLAFAGSAPLNVLDAAGALVWALGFAFEAVGDWQLARFKADPANKGLVLRTGLWRYTRHPNYFGDALVWWGLGLIAAAGGAWWALVSPMLMTWLLRRVSGVPLLEKHLARTRAGYADYAAQTSAFWPWPPRGDGPN
jgi:steroid 5-alpha reductase family enzyme